MLAPNSQRVTGGRLRITSAKLQKIIDISIQNMHQIAEKSVFFDKNAFFLPKMFAE
jgi:hypothetical protein